MTRVVADAATKVLNQRVVVDNRAGASGNIGADNVAKSPPTAIPEHDEQCAGPNVSLYKNLTYDLLRDSRPYAGDSSPHVVVVHPRSR